MHLTDGVHDVADLDAAAQGDVVGGLDDGAVEDRVAVRQSDLDDVAAALDHRADGPHAAVHGGEAGREVADQRGTSLGLGRGQDLAQQLDVAAHLTRSGFVSACPARSACSGRSVWSGSYRPK